MWRWLLIFSITIIPLGCGSAAEKKVPPDESSPPTMVDGAPADAASELGYTPIKVFYATDRARSGSESPNEFFSAKRRDEDLKWALDFGECVVTIPERHRKGELERPSIWRLEFRENEQKHVVLKTIRPIEMTKCLGALKKELAVDDSMIVFVHGFNVTFADAARRSAQIKHDLAFKGPVAFFSWPAPANYLECKDNSDWARPHLEKFLTEYVNKAGASKVHLIAHSMGTRVLSKALRELSRGKPDVKYNQIVLAAPDIDASTFKRDIAPAIIGSGERLSIYASSEDEALRLAKKTQGNYVRLGEGGVNLTTFPKLPIQVIDATAITESMLGHSYYGDSVYFLRDLRGAIDGLPPAERGLKSAKDHFLLLPAAKK